MIKRQEATETVHTKHQARTMVINSHGHCTNLVHAAVNKCQQATDTAHTKDQALTAVNRGEGAKDTAYMTQAGHALT